MSFSGFVKLYRSFEKWEWYGDLITKSVFIHLLINANFKESRFKGHVIPAGSLVVGRIKLSKDLGISERSVRTSLEHLKSTNEVTIKTTNRFSIVSLVNWGKYQCDNTEQPTNKPTNNRPTTDQQPTTSEECKNVRKKELNTYSSSNAEQHELIDPHLKITNDVIDYLNKKCGTTYKANSKKNQELVRARVREKFTYEDFQKVIDVKHEEWHENKELKIYLRPITLFGTKFESYLQQSNLPKEKSWIDIYNERKGLTNASE